MGFHTFVASETLTAANVNTYLMNQSVIVCTSGTRPASPVAGMTVFETDTTNYSVWNGAAWQTVISLAAWTAYTPAMSNITIGNGTANGFYLQIGKTVQFSARLVLGSTTTIGAQPGLGIPNTTAAREFNFPGIAYDTSANSSYAIVGHANGASSTGLLTTSSGNLSSTVPFTFATGDVIEFSGAYEAA